MAKCKLPCDDNCGHGQFTNEGDCPNDGWPQLDGYCTEHFAQFTLQPAADRAYEAQRLWHDHLTRLYQVEIAQGLRPAPLSEAAIKSGPPHLKAYRESTNPRIKALRNLNKANYEDDYDNIG